MITLLPLLLILLPPPHAAQLVINVSRGKEDSVPYRQALSGNTTTETVNIEFVTPGGTGVTHVTDFRSGVTITVVTQPGEEDLGQARCQVVFLRSHPYLLDSGTRFSASFHLHLPT